MSPNVLRAAAEARALTLALALVARMDWRLGRGPILGHAFTQYLYVPDPQLLIVPTTAGLEFAIRQVDPVIRDARSDAIIVSRSTEGVARYAFATWARQETVWTDPLALWLTDRETWLVPPPTSADTLGFRLRQTLHAVEAVPWCDPAARTTGYRRADAWMAQVVP